MSGSRRRQLAVTDADQEWFVTNPERAYRVLPVLIDEYALVRRRQMVIGPPVPTGHPYAVIRAYPMTRFLFELDKPLMMEDVGEEKAMRSTGAFALHRWTTWTI